MVPSPKAMLKQKWSVSSKTATHEQTEESGWQISNKVKAEQSDVDEDYTYLSRELEELRKNPPKLYVRQELLSTDSRYPILRPINLSYVAPLRESAVRSTVQGTLV